MNEMEVFQTNKDSLNEVESEYLRLLNTMKLLRKECPWDREQTLSSLRKYIIEEAYELVEAITNGDNEAIREECGDLLLQVIFITEIASETERFDINHVLSGLCEKLIRRHPHIFSDVSAEDSETVGKNWELIKKEEKKAKRKDSSAISGIPVSFPALLRAHRIQERAAKKGFDWPNGDHKPVINKVHEEIEELQQALAEKNEQHIREELGDLLFAVVNFSRHLEIDAEFALQDACEKFSHRFRFVENSVEASGREWSCFSLEELELFWVAAKEETGK